MGSDSGRVWEKYSEGFDSAWSEPVKDPFDFLGRCFLTAVVGTFYTGLAVVDQVEREPEQALATAFSTGVGLATGGLGGVALGTLAYAGGQTAVEAVKHERDCADALERYNQAHQEEAARRAKCTNTSDADAYFS